MELSGGDLDNVIRTTMAKAGENATPASMAVASVIRNRLAAGVTANRLPRSSTPPTNLSRGTKGQDVIPGQGDPHKPGFDYKSVPHTDILGQLFGGRTPA